MNFVTAKEVKEKLHISGVTLMRWKNEGKIKSMTLSTRKVLYDLDSIEEVEHTSQESEETTVSYKYLVYRITINYYLCRYFPIY